MQKKIRVSIAAVAALMLVVLAVNLVMGATSAANTSATKLNNMEVVEKLDSKETTEAKEGIAVDDSIAISTEIIENEEQLKELTPETFEEAESSIYPIRRRFIMWTYDGAHVMWGVYGNGRFAGTDNLGKRCWGIYGKGIFAGFYDGEFFIGKYYDGLWKAKYLFGLDQSRGEYVLFPTPELTADVAP